MEDVINLTGKFVYIVYQNATNFYTVAKFEPFQSEDRNITVTGILPEIDLDYVYELTGTYVEHPKYGYQFNVISCQKPLPTETDGIIRYLSSDRFPGIGKKKAELIVTALGDETLTLIQNDPDILRTIPKIKDKEIDIIIQGLKDDDTGLQKLIQFLNIHGLSTRSLGNIQKKYGSDSLQVLQDNPYKVCLEVDGFGFASADKLGTNLGIEKDDPRRIEAFIVTLLDAMCMNSGNTFIEKNEFEEEFKKKTKGFDIDFEESLSKCIDGKYIIQDENKLYPVIQYKSEVFISNFLNHFPFYDLEGVNNQIFNSYLDAIQKDLGITYDDTQINAIKTFFVVPFFILTGGPGTGKTTVVKAMVNLFRLLYPEHEILCAAPTGRAAKRLSEVTGSKSYTIHSLLQWNLDTNEFKKNEQDPLNCDLLIIDEFSMVDNYLFSNLLRASKNIKKICIIGDEDQLPSVSPGSVLRDLIGSNKFPVIRLNHIYRQKEGSDVISLAHDIRNNDIDLNRYHNDVSFFNTDETNIKNAIIRIVEGAIEKGYSLEEIQVLSPMYKGSGGIDVLNSALQQEFNPKDKFKNEVKIGPMYIREGDKVLQLKNQPDENVFNGDIGKVIEIISSSLSEDKKTTIICDFDGNFVEYKPENFQNITLAYCISVHKSQGSEYPIVIIPFQRQHIVLLTRKLIYTAITRSKKSLVMVGDQNILKYGCETDERHIRKTGLKERLINSEQKEFPF